MDQGVKLMADETLKKQNQIKKHTFNNVFNDLSDNLEAWHPTTNVKIFDKKEG